MKLTLAEALELLEKEPSIEDISNLLYGVIGQNIDQGIAFPKVIARQIAETLITRLAVQGDHCELKRIADYSLTCERDVLRDQQTKAEKAIKDRSTWLCPDY